MRSLLLKRPTALVAASTCPRRIDARRQFTPAVDSKSPVQVNVCAVLNFKVWSLGILNHVAIAVPDIEKATAFYRDVLNAQALPEHGVYTVFVNLNNTKIELLHPLGEKSPIQNFLNKKPDGGIHHVCIEVDDIYAALKDLTAKGIRSLDKEPKIGAHGKPVVFLHPKDCGGVLVELENK